MNITVVFATYNGSHTIERMLSRYMELIVPEDVNLEIIAVDNNSNDGSLALLKSYQNKLPLKVLKETKPGKNSALNKAIKEPLGDLVIFTDDDVLPHNNWLVEYCQLYRKLPEYDLFGGKILPFWESTPPIGLLKGIPVHVAFALTADNIDTGHIKAGKIYGPNMAVRRNVFEQGMTFNDAIGPNGKNYVMGSETDFLQRAEAKGYKAFFCNNVVVEHIIRSWQFDHDWLNNRAFKFGRAIVHNQIRENELEEHAVLWGYPRWGFRKLAELYIQRVHAKVQRKHVEFYQKDWEYNLNKGFLSEYKKYSQG